MNLHPDQSNGDHVVTLTTREQEIFEVFQMAVLEDGHSFEESAYWMLPLSKDIDPQFFDWLRTGATDHLSR